MKELELRMMVVTPLFMGGADNKKAELRPSSIKGLLRFWWRALHPYTDPKKLLEEENKIFGGAGSGQGRSKVIIKITPSPNPKTEDIKSYKNNPGINYLGYGVVGSGRKAIPPGYEFELQIKIDGLSPEEEQKIEDALWCMLHLGGLGSRSRRGFGSVVDARYIYRSKEELLEAIKKKLEDIRQGAQDQDGLPDYTAITKHTKVYILPPKDSWEKALNEVGVLLSQYRLGTRDKPAQIQRPESFVTETQEVKDFAATGKCPQKPPPRALFGLPHNYFFKDTGKKVSTEAKLHDTAITRRASPLFIHIHQLEGNQYVPIVSFIPAKFLPEGSQLVLKADSRECEVSLPPRYSPVFYSPVLDFLRKMPNSEVVP